MMNKNYNKKLALAFTGLCLLLAIYPSLTQAASSIKIIKGINWFQLLMQLFGGLAIFLYGMEKMSTSLKYVAGDRIKDILAKLSDNRIMGAITGTAVTAVIQSSSVTTVLLVGFVTAGLMSLSQSVGVIFGANIGTTITAQIVAFKVTKYAYILIALGFFMLFFSQKEKIKQYGYMLMGLGMIFFGMLIMGEAMKPLRSYEPFLNLMQHMSNPLLGVILGAAFTAFIQSSSATTGVVIVLAMQGLISLEAGIAISFGSNVGTCVTAGLASIGKPREAIRVFVVHTLFNVVGVLLIVGLIPWFAEFVREISPAVKSGLIGQAALADTVPRQIANAHTLFNVTMTLLFLPFITQFTRIANWIVPDEIEKPGDKPKIIQPKYINDILLSTPSLALESVRYETHRIGNKVIKMLKNIVPAITFGSYEKLEKIRKMDDNIDILYAHTIDYLTKIRGSNIDDQQAEALVDLMSVINNLESIGDIIETNMVALGKHRIDEKLVISEETTRVLNVLSVVVSKSLTEMVDAINNLDKKKAKQVLAMESDIKTVINKAEQQQAGRLFKTKSNKLSNYAVQIDVINELELIYFHIKKMAKSMLTVAKNKNFEKKSDVKSA